MQINQIRRAGRAQGVKQLGVVMRIANFSAQVIRNLADRHLPFIAHQAAKTRQFACGGIVVIVAVEYQALVHVAILISLHDVKHSPNVRAWPLWDALSERVLRGQTHPCANALKYSDEH